MSEGVVLERYQGTPQGGPLSPLLANVLLAMPTTATCTCAVSRRVHG